MNHWIIIDHPHSLVTALALAKFFASRKYTKPILVIAKHPYWSKVEMRDYRKHFLKIVWFDRLDIPPFSMPVWKQLAASVFLFGKLAILKIQVLKLNIDKNDVIIGLAERQILENMIISTFNQSWKVSIVPELVFTEEITTRQLVKLAKLRYSIGGFVARYIYYPIFGLHKNDYFITRGQGSKADGDRYWSFTEGLAKVYDKVLLMVNITDKRVAFSKIHPNLRLIPYPYLLVKPKSRQRKRKVVYFGMPYVPKWDITRKQYIEGINNYLQYIRANYPNYFSFEYRPHPQERDEYKDLDLAGFKLAEDRTMAEMYFLEDRGIEAVFSVCSTACRSALNFGLQGYIFPTLFPLKALNIESYKRVFGRTPSSFIVTGFSTPLKRFQFKKSTSVISDRLQKEISWVLSPGAD